MNAMGLTVTDFSCGETENMLEGIWVTLFQVVYDGSFTNS
jgi:hypothetical protein